MDHRPHIVVVEDETTQRRVLVDYLTRQNFRVSGVDGGPALRKLVERDLPEVVLLDVGLPGEDGFALIRKIRSLDGAIAKIPALALTGYEQTAGSDAVRPERFQQIAVKPIDPQALVAIVAGLASKA